MRNTAHGERCALCRATSLTESWSRVKHQNGHFLFALKKKKKKVFPIVNQIVKLAVQMVERTRKDECVYIGSGADIIASVV